MQKLIASVFFAVLATILALELLFRLLPVSTATHTDYHFDPDLLTYPAHHRWTVATGWDLRNPQVLRSNNFGFVSGIDFVPDETAIALIGDSYVESSMLDSNERPGAQLQRLIPSRPVYALGAPGSSLLDYAQRIRWASENFRIRDFVVLLERYDARQSICGSGNVHSRCLDAQTLEPRIERQEPAGVLKRYLRHSALAQYFAGQIRFRPERLLDAMLTRRTPEAGLSTSNRNSSAPPLDGPAWAQARKRVDAVVEAFYATAAPHIKGRLLFLVDGRRDGPATQPDLTDLERSHLIDRLRSRGADVIDLEPIYDAHARRSKLQLDVGPYDGHLNALGVSLVMAQAQGELLK